jgi:hypothetical protein
MSVSYVAVDWQVACPLPGLTVLIDAIGGTITGP